MTPTVISSPAAVDHSLHARPALALSQGQVVQWTQADHKEQQLTGHLGGLKAALSTWHFFSHWSWSVIVYWPVNSKCMACHLQFESINGRRPFQGTHAVKDFLLIFVKLVKMQPFPLYCQLFGRQLSLSQAASGTMKGLPYLSFRTFQIPTYLHPQLCLPLWRGKLSDRTFSRSLRGATMRVHEGHLSVSRFNLFTAKHCSIRCRQVVYASQGCYCLGCVISLLWCCHSLKGWLRLEWCTTF